MLTPRATLAFVVLLALAPAARAAETLKVLVPQRGNWDSSLVEFGVRQGFFAAEGLTIEPSYSEGGAIAEQSLAAGSVDIALAAGMLGVVAAYVKGLPVRIVSAQATGAPDLYWYAKWESGIRTLQDAVGRTIAYSASGSSTNLVLLALLKQTGVAARPVATGGVPATFTQLMSGQIDIGWASPPTALPEIRSGSLVVVARGSDVAAINQQTIRANIAMAATVARRRAALARFARAYEKAWNWAYSDPKAIDLYANELHLPRALAAQAAALFPKAMLDPGAVKGLQRTLDDAYAFRRIPHPMTPADVAGLIDIVKPGG